MNVLCLWHRYRWSSNWSPAQNKPIAVSCVSQSTTQRPQIDNWWSICRRLCPSRRQRTPSSDCIRQWSTISQSIVMAAVFWQRQCCAICRTPTVSGADKLDAMPDSADMIAIVRATVAAAQTRGWPSYRLPSPAAIAMRAAPRGYAFSIEAISVIRVSVD